MCDICMQNPCDYRCPNTQDSKTKIVCTSCGEAIFKMEKYFSSDEGPVCEACMQEKNYDEILAIFGESMRTA